MTEQTKSGEIDLDLPVEAPALEPTTTGQTSTMISSSLFNLKIDGALNVQEQEKLRDVLLKEDLGIRDLDLEPQFHAGRILIPQISEYLGIWIIQQLRGSNTVMSLDPAQGNESQFWAGESKLQVQEFESELPAASIPLSPHSALSGNSPFTVIDVVTAHATLDTSALEAEQSDEYTELLEALKLELKHKAFHKRASALLNFSVQLTPLSQPTLYKVMAMATAVKPINS